MGNALTQVFREAVLNDFGGRCGITQLAVRELLVASHILPWSDHPQERLNVRQRHLPLAPARRRV